MKSDSNTGKSKKSAIEQQALINEIIKRDDKFYSLNQDFHLDLKSLKIIPPRPNYVNRNNLDLEKRQKAIPEEIKEKIRNQYSSIPSQRHNYPVCRSMEYGWEKPVGLNTTVPRVRKNNDINSYGYRYFQMKDQMK